MGRHNEEILSNLKVWERKPLLRTLYRSFYTEIRREMATSLPGMVVELGSGIGKIREVIPECVTTDIFPNMWIDQVEDAYELSFPDKSVSNLILCDVFHHLRYPFAALHEFARVLCPGGRLIILEPDMGLLGRIVFGLFHTEPLRLGESICLSRDINTRNTAEMYYAAQGNAYRLFLKGECSDVLPEGLCIDRIRRSCALAYAASGGFSGPQLYPDCLYRIMKGLGIVLSLAPSLFSLRLLVVLSKQN